MNLGFVGNEFDRLVVREIALVARKRSALVKLARVREAASVALAEDSEAMPELLEVAKLSESVQAASRAIELVRERRPRAIMNSLRSLAETIRGPAAAKTQELNALKEKTGRLYAELSKLEGVEFGDWVLNFQKEGLVAWGALEKTTSRSHRLEAEIQEIADRVSRLDIAVPTYGFVHLEGVTGDDPVVEAVLRHKSAGPSAEAVIAWLTACASAPRLHGCGFGDHSRSVRIEWNSEVIDTSASNVYVAGLASSSPATLGGYFKKPADMTPIGYDPATPLRYNYDVPSGTFRSAA